jgi:hypothetical protein
MVHESLYRKLTTEQHVDDPTKYLWWTVVLMKGKHEATHVRPVKLLILNNLF